MVRCAGKAEVVENLIGVHTLTLLLVLCDIDDCHRKKTYNVITISL